MNIAAVVSTLIGIGGVGVLIRQLWPTSFLRRVIRFLDAWEGTLDQPGVISQLTDHTLRIVALETRDAAEPEESPHE